MKTRQRLLVIAGVLSILIPGICYGYCEGVTRIEIDPIGDFLNARTKFVTALENYDNAQYKTNGRYELCFDFKSPLYIEEASHFISFPKHSPAGDVLDVVISGVHLEEYTGSTDAVFSVLDTSAMKFSVVLENFNISDAKSGIKYSASHGEIIGATIAGKPGGTCLDLVSASGSIVRGSTISGCDNGIRVDGSDDVLIGAADAARYDADKNVITENGIGIYLEKGHGVRFGYNENYGNFRIAPLTANAVVIAEGMNGGVMPPLVIPYENEDGSFTLECEKDSEGKITSRRIHFDNPPGTVQLYAADLTAGQAEQFIGDCEIAADGYCNCTILPDWVPVDEDECGVSDGLEFAITAIFSNSNSSELMEPKLFNGPYVVFAGTGIVQTTPSSEAGDTFIEATPVGGGASGEGGGIEMLAPSIAGGCGRSGASLIPNDIMRTFAPSLGLWWIIFGVGLLAGLRYRFARIMERRRR